MYKTCFECPHIRILNPGSKRILYHCPKLYSVYGKPFILYWKGTRPRICPLLKRNKKGRKRNERR